MPQGTEGARNDSAGTDPSAEPYSLLDAIAKCDGRECGAGGEEGGRTRFVCRQRPVPVTLKGLGVLDVVDVSVVNVSAAGSEDGLPTVSDVVDLSAGSASAAPLSSSAAAGFAPTTLSAGVTSFNVPADTCEVNVSAAGCEGGLAAASVRVAAPAGASPLASCEKSETESGGGGEGGGGGGAWSWSSLATETYTAPSFGQLLGTWTRIQHTYTQLDVTHTHSFDATHAHSF